VVQWVSQTNSVDVRAVLLKPGDRLFIPFNLTVETPFYIDFGDFQIAVPRVITNYGRDSIYMTVGVPRGIDVYFKCYDSRWGWGCFGGGGAWGSYGYYGEYMVRFWEAGVNIGRVGNKLVIYVGGKWKSTSPFGMWYPELVDPVYTVEIVSEEVWPRPDWVWGARVGVYLNGKKVGELVYDLGPGGIRLVRWTVKEGRYGVYVENRGGKLWMTASPGSAYAALVYTSSDAIPYVATRPVIVKVGSSLVWLNDVPNSLVLPMYKPIPQETARTAVLAALKTTENLAQRYRLMVNYTVYCYNYTRGAYISAWLYLSSAQGEPLVSAGVLMQGPKIDYSCHAEPPRGGGGGGGKSLDNECPVYISSNARPIGFLAPQWQGDKFISGLKAEVTTIKVDCRGNKQTDTRQDTVRTWVNINGVMGIADASGNYCGASQAQPSGQGSNVAQCSQNG